MAKREALRQFQSHLANRLSAARTTGVAASWLAVEAAAVRYLFPLNQSGEIFPWANTQPVPYTQSWFLGVANLPGGLYGVIDLGGFVAGTTPDPRAESSRDQARLVALNSVLEVNCALLIDRLVGLRSMDSFVDSAPACDTAPGYFGSGYTDADGAYWQEINLQSLSQQPRFLSISA